MPTPTHLLSADQTVAAPLAIHRETVRPEWIDYNGHLNVAYYLLAFDHATDALLDLIGLGHDHVRQHGGSIFILETHVSYHREVVAGDPLVFTTQLFDFDAKRIHHAHRMHHAEAGYLAATNELMLLHVDLASRRGAPMPAAAIERLGRIRAAHAGLARPQGLSRVIGLTRPAR